MEALTYKLGITRAQRAQLENVWSVVSEDVEKRLQTMPFFKDAFREAREREGEAAKAIREAVETISFDHKRR